MKITVFALLLAGAAGSLLAQEGTTWLELQGAYVVPHHNEIKSAVGFGGGLGTWFSDNWGMEVSALSWNMKDKNDSSVGGTETHAFLSGLYSLGSANPAFNPFLRAGVGYSQTPAPYSFKTGSTSAVNFFAGLGFQSALGENWLWSGEVRGVRVNDSPAHYEGMALVGLGLRWGGASKPAPRPSTPVYVPHPEPKVEPEPAPLPPPPPPPAQQPKPVPPPPPPPLPPPPPPKKIVLDQAVLHFANGQNVLSADGMSAVQKVAGDLKAFSGEYTIWVSGHTSSTGNPGFNKTLSKRRADAVAKVLVDSGIPATSVMTVGVGADEPLADNKTPEGQARNRRVEIEVKVKGAVVEKRTITTGVQEAPAAPAKPRKKKKAKSDIQWK